MIGFDLEGNVIGGPGSLGDDESGADLSSVSVLNVAPTTQSTATKKTAKSLLYDPTKPATSATHEGLYRNRKAAMKAAGVTYGTQAYKDWDEATRALMGVGPKDKFSSGAWMSKFGTMDEEEINEAAGNIEYYLDDTLSSASSAFKADKGKKAAMDATHQLHLAHSQQLPGIATLATGKYRATPGYELKVLPSAGEFMTKHLNELQEKHPSWRTPTPFFYDEGLGNYPFQKAPGPGAIGSSLAYGSYREPAYSHDARFSSGAEFSPIEKFTAVNAATGKIYGEKTTQGLTPHIFESRRSSNVQPLKGDIPLSIGGVAEEGVKSPGFPTTHSFMPNELHGVYNPLADIEPSSHFNYNPTGMQDLIRINADTVKELVRKGFPADEIEQHESWHLVHRTLANNAPMWANTVDFKNPVTGKTEKLIDVISNVDKNGQYTFDREALHIAIFGYDPQFLDEPIKNRYNHHDLFSGRHLSEKMQIARALGLALNEAAVIVDNIYTNSPQTIPQWRGKVKAFYNNKRPIWSSEQ